MICLLTVLVGKTDVYKSVKFCHIRFKYSFRTVIFLEQ